MDVDEQRRIANNEIVFRNHNEAISDAVEEFRGDPDSDDTHGVMCECALPECEESLELTMAQYQEGRSEPEWFLVKPGHVIAGIEHKVHDRAAYWIIAKEGEGRKLAEADAAD